MNVEQVKQTLQAMAEQAHAQEKLLDHILLLGGRALTQEVIAYIATSLPFFMRRSIARNFERAGDMAAVLTHLKQGNILFVDEIQDFTQAVVEVFYTVLSENKLDLVIGKGLAAKNVRLDLARFTTVATTSQIERVPRRIIESFPVQFQLDPPDSLPVH